MLIKSIKLENIRSYLSQEIVFPQGSTLLAGDIGSGKSSILLAIEFALFGIRGKSLSGAALLRNGKRTGSVELRFELDNKQIIIKRGLKQLKDAVQQDAGYVIVDNVKMNKTPTELKAFIFELLGYPKKQVSKTKNLVYRFTVYTPQEEMKQILLEPEEARVDTLRKVFGIDRYRQIRENSQIIIRKLKEKIRQGQGQILDLEQKQKQKQEHENEILDMSQKLARIEPELQKAMQDIKEKKTIIQQFEQDMKKFNQVKNELTRTEVDLKHQHGQYARNDSQINILNSKIKEIQIPEMIDVEKIKTNILEKRSGINQKELVLKNLNQKLSEFMVKRRTAEDNKTKILNIAVCPYCEQEVSKEHKDKIIYRENNIIQEMGANLTGLKTNGQSEEKILSLLKQELEQLQKKESEAGLIQLKINNLKEKQKQMSELNLSQEQIKKTIQEFSAKKLELSKQLEIFANPEASYSNARQELDKAQNYEKNIELEKTALESRKWQIEKAILILQEEVTAKLKAKERIAHHSQLRNWLEEYFINLMVAMEKQVMAKAHYDFNMFFQDWFNILIEDEAINVKLDDSFTPVIEQNGYETAFESLSGGERTAAALAYRLSLNKVINELMSTIKTRSLIILDEPTDGFSTEQLDRVRDVLQQINAGQIIIVSHESKIESFVDNIIRIYKHEHISGIDNVNTGAVV